MALNDVYELVDVQTFGGQTMLNAYFYQQRAAILAGNIPQQLADTFVTNVLPSIRAVQTADTRHTEIRVRNLFNESENVTSLVSLAGTSGDPDTAAPFEAVGFRLKQDNGAIRNGAKRIGGIQGNIAEDGVIVDTGIVTALLAIGTAMVLGLDVGIVANAFLPVIVKRLLVAGKYELPDSLADAVVGTVTDALYNANETSQVSRKFGRGE